VNVEEVLPICKAWFPSFRRRRTRSCAQKTWKLAG